jgi:hypothetical protein
MGKKFLLGYILLVLLAGIASARVLVDITSPPIVTAPIMRVTMINQMPDPAEPGKYVDVRFKFENNGSQTARDVEAEILPEYPFSLDPGEPAIKRLGSISPRQKGDNGVIIKFRLRVDKDALEGQNEIKLRYRTSENVWITLPEFKINIQPYDAILLLDKVRPVPETIKPGEKARIEITFRNMAEILLKKIRVKLKLSSAPLAPIGSTNEKVIEKIGKGEESMLLFDIIAEPDAKSGVYTIPVEFVYYDSLGNSYSRNSTIGLIVGSEPDIAASIDSTTVYQPKKRGEVAIKIVNKGVNDVKFVNVKLAESKDYTIISPKEVYIGNIDSDDYETAEFKIFVKKATEGTVILPLTLEYKDANNLGYTKKVNLKLPLYSASEAKKLGLVKGNSKTGLLIVVVIVTVGIFAYRKWKRGKRKKH